MNKEITKDFTAYLDQWCGLNYRNDTLPGFTICVRKKSDIIFSQAYGYANLDTSEKMTTKHIFCAASHSKTITAVAVMQLKEVGKLRLDDKVVDHVEWFSSTADKRIADIRIRDLLNHTSGMSRDSEECDFWKLKKTFPSEKDLKKYIKDATLVQEVNHSFKYSNFGYSYLGLLVEKVSGEKYVDYVAQHVFKSLGLRNTYANYDSDKTALYATGHTGDLFHRKRQVLDHVDTRAMSAATGLCSTAEDLSCFYSALELGTKKLLTDTSKREMLQGYWVSNESSSERYGLGVDMEVIDGEQWRGHSGGFPGFVTITMSHPLGGYAISICTNAWDAHSYNMFQNAAKILNKFVDAIGKPTERLRRFEGVYHSESSVINIVCIGKKLYAKGPLGWSNFGGATELSYIDEATLKIQKTNLYGSVNEEVYFTFKRDKVKSIKYAGITMTPLEA